MGSTILIILLFLAAVGCFIFGFTHRPSPARAHRSAEPVLDEQEDDDVDGDEAEDDEHSDTERKKSASSDARASRKSHGARSAASPTSSIASRALDVDSFLPHPDGGSVRRIAYIAGTCLLVLDAITLVTNTAVQVPTKEYGVVTSFGKPTGVFSNGLHWKAPWQRVTTIDAAIQTDAYEQKGSGGNCINVRIAHQATACVDVSIRWRIRESSTRGLFQNYRNFDNIRDSLTVRELSSSLNDVMGDYDPLSVDDNGNADTPPLTTISGQVKSMMTREIGDQIEVLSIFIPVVHFDDNTQSKVNALLGQVAQTRIAAQGVKTAEQQAKANETLASSVSKDPNVLVNKCLDLIESGKLDPPAGFSCWPNSSSAVVVPSGSPSSSSSSSAR